jgi:hypothetical protein
MPNGERVFGYRLSRIYINLHMIIIYMLNNNYLHFFFHVKIIYLFK